MMLMRLQWTVGALLPWLREKLLTERPELFMKGNSVWVQTCPVFSRCSCQVWEII
jgi:hypothetical protein